MKKCWLMLLLILVMAACATPPRAYEPSYEEPSRQWLPTRPLQPGDMTSA